MNIDDVIRHPVVAAAFERHGMSVEDAIAARAAQAGEGGHSMVLPRGVHGEPALELTAEKAVVGWSGSTVTIQRTWSDGGALGGTIHLTQDAVPLSVLLACVGRSVHDVVHVPGAHDMRITAAEGRAGTQILRCR